MTEVKELMGMLLLLVGDDWAEDHHDVEIIDPGGRTLAKGRLPDGIAGLARLHALIAGQLGDDAEQVEVRIGIETDRGPWVAALTAAVTEYRRDLVVMCPRYPSVCSQASIPAFPGSVASLAKVDRITRV
jgi:hypothetical protein